MINSLVLEHLVQKTCISDIFSSLGFTSAKMGAFCSWFTSFLIPGLSKFSQSCVSVLFSIFITVKCAFYFAFLPNTHKKGAKKKKEILLCACFSALNCVLNWLYLIAYLLWCTVFMYLLCCGAHKIYSKSSGNSYSSNGQEDLFFLSVMLWLSEANCHPLDLLTFFTHFLLVDSFDN